MVAGELRRAIVRTVVDDDHLEIDSCQLLRRKSVEAIGKGGCGVPYRNDDADSGTHVHTPEGTLRMGGARQATMAR